MKIYMFYANKEYLMIDTSYMGADHISSDNTFMYAFTNSKKLAMEFKESRDDAFIMRVHDISKSKYKDMKSKYYRYELKLEDIKIGNKEKYSILTTRFEMDSVDDLVDGMDADIYELVSTPYEIFKDKYQVELDNILYTYYHDISHGDDSTSEMADNNMNGYYMTPLGKCPIYYFPNIIVLFIEKFYRLFK